MSGAPEWVYIYDPENAVEYGVKITDQKGAGIQSVRYGYVRVDIFEAAKAAARAEGERIGMERATMPDREMIAFVLWKAEADRAAPNVGRTRTLAGFSDESEYTRTKWLSLADAIRAAMDARP